MKPFDKARAGADEILDLIAPREQLATESLRDTSKRMVRALAELTAGYHSDLDLMFKTFDSEGYDQIIVVRETPFVSLCEHHVLPFTGTVSVAYVPSDRIVGLSKIPRLVRALSRRLQVQERLTRQIANEMMERLQPRGVFVVVRGHHTCMSLRGVEAPGEMVTSAVRGVFMDNASARTEAMVLMGEKR